ncbi:MAG: hypothetical protein R6V57_00050 [Vicinamibacterales bacterium]
MSTPGFVDPAAWRTSSLVLATLIDRQTPIEWFEAAAIVQELCALVPDGRGAGPRAVLEPGDVAITSEGGVDVRGGVGGVPTVAQVAHLLLALIEGAHALPVQLRLLALQEVSPTPGCATLRDLAGRLAPFERPNRRQTIRDLYERVTALPARDVERPTPQPVRPHPARAAARPPWWRSRPVRTAAASIAVLVAAGVALAWLWQAVAPMLSRQGDRRDSEAGAVAESLSAADVERIWATARRIWRSREAPSAQPAPGVAPADLPGAEPVILAPPVNRPPAPAAPSGPAALRVPAAAADTSASAIGTMIFTRADVGVVPPVLVRPRLPESPRPGVRAEDLPQVEVVVSETGEVESVKLVSERAGVGPAMMLSVIKAWRFAPATRAGRPVRYRLVVPLTNQ